MVSVIVLIVRLTDSKGATMTERTVIHDAWLVNCSECEDALHECGQSRRLVSVPWCITDDKQAIWGVYKKLPNGDLDFDDFTFTSCEFGNPSRCVIEDGVVWRTVKGRLPTHKGVPREDVEYEQDLSRAATSVASEMRPRRQGF